MPNFRLPCPRCSGTGTDTHEDRHAETNMDTCRGCGGTGGEEASQRHALGVRDAGAKVKSLLTPVTLRSTP